MKLLGSTKSKILKDENVPYLEINEVILIHFNVVNNSYQRNSRVLYTFVPNKPFGQLLDISLKILYFQKLLTQNFCTLKRGLPIKILIL